MDSKAEFLENYLLHFFRHLTLSHGHVLDVLDDIVSVQKVQVKIDNKAS